MSLSIPESLKDKVHEMPESSYGATRVTLILSNQRKIREVSLAWGEEIVKIGLNEVKEETDLDFKVSEIVDVQ